MKAFPHTFIIFWSSTTVLGFYTVRLTIRTCLCLFWTSRYSSLLQLLDFLQQINFNNKCIIKFAKNVLFVILMLKGVGGHFYKPVLRCRVF